MINRGINTKVYLAAGSTDMRKSINGLTAIIQECFKLDVFSQSTFVFCNKSKDKIKIVQWENNGFWLHYKRLENGSFKWPESNREVIEISDRELGWMLEGLSINQKEAHHKMDIKNVI
jgi:transposase